MSCCNNTTNGLNNKDLDNLNFVGATGQNITITNSADFTNANVTFHNLVGNTGSTVSATTGSFTNLIGGPISNSKLLLKDTNNDFFGDTLVITNNTGTTGPFSEGIHLLYNNVNKVGSIYNINNSGLCSPLYLNYPVGVADSDVYVSSLKSNSINEFTINNGVQIQNGIKFLNNSKTIENSVDDIILNTTNITNNTIRLQNSSVDKLTVNSTTTTNNNILNQNENIVIPISKSISMNSGQTVYTNNSLKMTNCQLDGLRFSTVDSSNPNWISASFGIEGSNVSRVVIGNLSGNATIGGHLWNGTNYVSWNNLYLNPGGGSVNINSASYFSPNNLTCGGYIDCQNGYKINNAARLEYAGGSTANIFIYPNKPSSTYTIATTSDLPSTYLPSVYMTSSLNVIKNGFMKYNSMNTNEDQCQYLISSNCSITNLRISLSSPPGAGNTFTFTYRINGVDTALTASISNSSTLGNSGGTVINVNQDDLWSIQLTTNTSGPYLSQAYVTFDVRRNF